MFMSFAYFVHVGVVRILVGNKLLKLNSGLVADFFEA